VRNEGAYTNEFSANVDVTAQLALAVNDDNSLNISFPEAPVITVNDAEVNLLLNGLVQFDSAFIETVVANVVTLALPEIAESLSSIELPAFHGLSIVPLQFEGLGDNDAHLGVAAELIVVEPSGVAE